MINGVTQYVVAVKDLDDAIEAYTALGFTFDRRDRNEGLGIDQAYFHMGDGSVIELAAPFDPKSAIGRGLERNGEGLYMLSLEVDDVEAAAQKMKDNGVQLIDAGDRVFVHPRSTKGILMRLDPKEG
ncbi:MAG: methylmalonyl-CoA epimerase [Rhodospirillaceae bacterium]|jgi:methylmalonyl-CoA/ethylmalonyl-CoA epimerase|nr:methylmalonyl-CoA epimerase [Rhodospirillaceae bacterium]MBT5666406.1 methylmalonyl-CoA epimerase [Rhodospirillaceae bacterium]MBT5809814.1 methylmalonyl-CoA epimerase [Rhodospirillaceae bacterium]